MTRAAQGSARCAASRACAGLGASPVSGDIAMPSTAVHCRAARSRRAVPVPVASGAFSEQLPDDAGDRRKRSGLRLRDERKRHGDEAEVREPSRHGSSAPAARRIRSPRARMPSTSFSSDAMPISVRISGGCQKNEAHAVAHHLVQARNFQHLVHTLRRAAVVRQRHVAEVFGPDMEAVVVVGDRVGKELVDGIARRSPACHRRSNACCCTMRPKLLWMTRNASGDAA